MEPRRLYRSRRDRKLAGIAGGMAEYLGLDPTVVRVLWVVSIFFFGFTILLYIVLAFIIPIEPLQAPMPPAPVAPVPTPAAGAPGASQPPTTEAPAAVEPPADLR